eukprot:31100-Pelagococcus_subviridis.AAC.5
MTFYVLYYRPKSDRPTEFAELSRHPRIGARHPPRHVGRSDRSARATSSTMMASVALAPSRVVAPRVRTSSSAIVRPRIDPRVVEGSSS